METITAATSTAQTSPRASYADIARTPPDSNPSNVRSLSSTHATSSDLDDALYCTIDISRIEETESEDTSAGAIRNLIETGVQTELGRPDWRCRAVTKDRKSSHRIRIACRNENEHQLVKQVAEANAPRGARVLRDEWYPVKVDNVNGLAVLDELDTVRPEAAKVFSQENDVQVTKVAWLSNRDSPKAYGSMVVYLTKASDARKILQEGFFYAGGESGVAKHFERRFRPEQCHNCQEIGHKRFQCPKPQRCGKCAREGHHHRERVEPILKCVLCGGPHESFSRNCRTLFPIHNE